MGEQYARATGYPVQYQSTRLEGVNDTDAGLYGIVRLLQGKHAVMNFIPCNETQNDGGPAFRRPEHCRRLRPVVPPQPRAGRLKVNRGMNVSALPGRQFS